MIPPETIALVRERTDILAIIQEAVPSLKRRGRSFVGLCPFHKEKTPSFHVNPDRGFFHCFGCKEAGSAIDFLLKHDGYTFPEAVRALAERVFILVAMKRDADALALFKAYPNVGGPLAKWLRAYAVASHGKLDEARAAVSQEDPPPAAAPLPARIIAAMAFAAMKDARHGSDYVKALAHGGFANPDVVFAAEKVGAGKVGRRVR